MNIPKDPVMLWSYINTQLRDNYSSLDDLCRTLDLDRADLENRLKTIGYVYNSELNKFI